MGDILDQTIVELENEKDKTLHLLKRGLELTKMVDEQIDIIKNKDTEFNECMTAMTKMVDKQHDIIKNKDILLAKCAKTTFELSVFEDKYNIIREFITMCDLEEDFKTYLDSIEMPAELFVD